MATKIKKDDLVVAPYNYIKAVGIVQRVLKNLKGEEIAVIKFSNPGEDATYLTSSLTVIDKKFAKKLNFDVKL